MSDAPLTTAALRERREKTIARLCEHFARDHIEADELERLIDRAHQATSLAQLDEVISGLPSLKPAQPQPQQATEVWRNPIRPNETIIAVMGGAERRGAWAPAHKMYVTAVMGGVLLDFRDAQLGPGVTEIFVVAIMGGVEIIVPADVAVESEGIGIMGGFGHGGSTRFPIDGSAPVLRLTGLALMGGVEIRERPSSGWGERERERERELSRRERQRLEQGETRDAVRWVDKDR